MSDEKTRCCWTENSDGMWDTGCGNCFIIEEGPPSENNMRYCCYCGKPLSEERYAEPQEDDE